MKNVYVEGIQGMGKSTLVNRIAAAIPEMKVCREGDYSPVDLAWCAWMSEQEYKSILEKYAPIQDEIVKATVREQEHYIIPYTTIITDLPGFHKDLENYEIYNGRKTISELKEIILTRYKNFTETGYLFECSFFQNIMEDLILFHMLSDEEIVAFYRELYEVMDTENFLLLYLYSDNLEEHIKMIQKERCDNNGNELWYQMMSEYVQHSPYGRKNGCTTFDDLLNHFRHRQQLELAIIDEVLKDKVMIIPAKEYDIEPLITFIV